MSYSIAIPHQSEKAFWNATSKNAGLIFDRFIPDLREKSDSKKDGLIKVKEAFDRRDIELFKAWRKRWILTAQAAGAHPFKLKTEWRLIAGLGRKGMLEVGFTFHRYGFPYLPGSSIKGLARMYALLEIAKSLGGDKFKNEEESKEKDAPLTKLEHALSEDEEGKFEKAFGAFLPNHDAREMAQAFRLIFGTTNNAGKAVFFDAVPSETCALTLDIMNPHYPDYYKEGSKEPPTNWQSPIPVYFLAVSSGSDFHFAIGWRKPEEDQKFKAVETQQPWSWFKGERLAQQAPTNAFQIQKLARRWLQGGLLDLGIGGKTSAGYGYFKE